MSGKPQYPEAQRAMVYVVLASNDGNVKRTARDVGVPEATIRRWRDDWAVNGPPRQDEIDLVLDDFVEAVTTVRNAALTEIHRQIKSRELKGAALVTAFRDLTDSINRANGLAIGKVKHEHELKLPDRIEIAELLQGFASEARSLSLERQADIIEAELVEPPALPVGK